MKEYFLPLAAVFTLTFLIKKVRTRGIKFYTNEEIKDLLDKKECKLIDVREYSEMNSTGYAAGAVPLPLSTFDSQIPRLDRGAKYILMCASGARAQSAYFKMRKLGFIDVSLAKSGFSSWEYEKNYRN